MKINILFLLIALFALPVYGQQPTAKEILDNTASAFRSGGGMEASFFIKVFRSGQEEGQTAGTIKVDGEKFVLETPDAITWYNGETQWSYMLGSDEVNVSNPLEEELQTINPYALISLYKDGYKYKREADTIINGKKAYEVVLTATDKKHDITSLKLYVSASQHQLLYIIAELKDKSRNEITMGNYKTGLSFAPSFFVFDSNKYPEAEIIDLR